MEVKKFPKDDSASFYGYWVIVAAIFITMAIWAAYYTFGIFFKPMLTEFGWTRAMTSGAFSLSAILSGCLAIAMGGLNDKLGPRLVMTLCGLLLGLGYILMSQVRAVWQLYLFYGVIIGAGMGGAFIPLMSTIARWFVERRSLMTGIVAASIGVGALVGPMAAYHLISAYGWRLSYAIMGTVVLAVVVPASQVIKRNPAQVGQVAYGMDKDEQNVVNSGIDGISLNEAFHKSQFWVLSWTFFCYGFCLFTVMVHMAPHANDLGISDARSANILAILGGLSIVGKIFLGRVGDTTGSKWTMVIGFTLMAAALIWLVPASRVWTLYSIAALFGVSYGGCTVAHSPLVATLFGLKSHGLIFGVLSLSITLGGAIGPFLAGYIFDITDSYRVAFLVCGIVSFSGMILSAVLKEKRISTTR